MALLKRAGCVEVRIGVESGNERIRSQVLCKKVTDDDIYQAFRRLKAAGIRRWSFNMLGLPYETPRTLRDTIRLNQKLRPDQLFCSIFQPYPGTHAYDICKENGWLTGRSTGSYFEHEYTVNQPTISRQRVVFYHDIFQALVNWPLLSPLIILLRAIPVSRTKTLWNVWRRIRAKVVEAGMRLRKKDAR